MDTVHPETTQASDPAHRELELLLPWFVKGRLEVAEARQVQDHLATCPSCREEVEGLSKLFAAHEATTSREMAARHPSEDAQLKDVLARIDAYEAQRSGRAARQNGSEPMRSSFLVTLGAALAGFLSARPVLLASTFAAVVLAVIAVPMLRTSAPEYGLLSSSEPMPNSLSVRMSVSASVTQKDVERLVQSGLREHEIQGRYQVKNNGSGEYIVTLEEKPPIDALSHLIGEWQGAPNVTDVQIDGGAAP
jgi:anti-sigma factor RsiW